MRLFLAIDLPKEVKEYLYGLQSTVKEAKVAWVSKKNLHISLKFLGEVNEEKIEEIKQGIQIQHAPFTLTLTNLGFFPNVENPKVVWVGLQPEQALIALAQKIDGELLTLFSGEQEFKAHITLGRVKSIRRKEAFQKSIRSLEIKPFSFTVNSFQLMSSVLRRGGATYEVLEHVTLS